MNGLNVDPPWAESLVTEFWRCSRSSPPYIPLTPPVAGSIETAATRSPGLSGSPPVSSGEGISSATPASTAAWTAGSYVVTTRSPPVSMAVSSYPSLTSSSRAVCSRYPRGPA